MADKSGAEIVLLVRVAELACAIPIADVIETMRTLPVSDLAGTPPYVAGVSVVRGQPLPVVDLGALLKTGETARARKWFIAVRVAERCAIVCVDRVSGVRSIEQSSFCELPPLLRGADSEPLRALGRLDRELVVMLDTCRAVPAELFEQLDALR